MTFNEASEAGDIRNVWSAMSPKDMPLDTLPSRVNYGSSSEESTPGKR